MLIKTIRHTHTPHPAYKPPRRWSFVGIRLSQLTTKAGGSRPQLCFAHIRLLFCSRTSSVPLIPAIRNYGLSSWDHPVDHHHGHLQRSTPYQEGQQVHNGVTNSEAVWTSETLEILKGNWDRQGFGTQIKFFTPRKFGSSASIQFGKL